MSEPSSGVPGEIADADVETQQPPDDTPERVELDVDQDKLDAWEEVRSDYQVDPDAESSPDSQESNGSSPADEGAVDESRVDESKVDEGKVDEGTADEAEANEDEGEENAG